MDTSDVVILNNYLDSLLLGDGRDLRRQGLGYFSQGESYEAMIRGQARRFNTKPGRAWWQLARERGGVPHEIVLVMDDALANLELRDGFGKDIDQVLTLSGADLNKARERVCTFSS